jgi:nucleoside-diphosphate-sugar epimerase
VSTTLLKKVLVVGSTGATGKHVVRMLLDQGDTNVVALTRSRERLMDTLSLDEKEATNLSVKEASIGSLSAGELKDLTEGCTAVVT